MLPIKVNVSSSGGIQPNVKRRFSGKVMEATRRPKAGHGSPAFEVTMAASITMRLERPTMRSMPTCFTFAQAQERARTFFGQKARELAATASRKLGPIRSKPRSGTILQRASAGAPRACEPTGTPPRPG
jgi:hypothetical protein